MKKLKNINIFILSIMLFSVVGCASTANPESTGGEYFDDTIITTKVKTVFFNESSLKSSEINVETL